MCLTSLKLSCPFGGFLYCKGMEFRHTSQAGGHPLSEFGYVKKTYSALGSASGVTPMTQMREQYPPLQRRKGSPIHRATWDNR